MSQRFDVSPERNSDSVRVAEETEVMESLEHIEHVDAILELTEDDSSSRHIEEWADESYEQRLLRKQQEYNNSFRSGAQSEEDSVDLKANYQDRMSRLEHRMGLHDDELNRSADILALTADSSGTHDRYGTAATSPPHDKHAKNSSSKPGYIPQKTPSFLSHASTSEVAARRPDSIRSAPMRTKSDELSHSQASDAPIRKRFSEDRDVKQRVTDRQSRRNLRRADTVPTQPTGASNMILRQPSMSYQQSSKVSNRPTSGRNVPGAYVVAGVSTSGVLEEEELVDMSSVGGDVSQNADLSPDGAAAPQNQGLSIEPAEESSMFPTIQEATIEQPIPEDKVAERRYRFWIIGFVVVVFVGVAIGVGVGVSSRAKDASTQEGIPTPSPTLGSPTPTLATCSVDAIYEECEGQVGGSFANDIPDCAVESYASVRAAFLPELDPNTEIEPTSCSPENLALLTLAANGETSRNKSILNTFYFATNGYGWKTSTNWLSKQSECLWHGVACFENTTVIIGIVLDANDLSGSIPSVVGLLDAVEKLDMQYNALGGTIPEELANLASLIDLNLQHNSFESGPIPSFLYGHDNLVQLNLRRTQRTGTLPNELLSESQLRGLALDENSLTGSIPSQLFSLPLADLTLASNILIGPIPSEIGLLPSDVNSITFLNNGLTGTMPTEAGRLTSLSYFLLSANSLSGFIPYEVCGLWDYGALEVFGGPDPVCRGSPIFYGGLACPSEECCRNCPDLFEN